ncbi:MAG TPA: Uma2 family endonuclease [Thermoanaerobaculia bacterium]|nr:Uma2 family endonuclease [Thermoanaerobaculia bacterium]
MALRDLSPKLTYEDYILLPDDGRRHEIIEGVHYVTAAPFVRHQRVSLGLSTEFSNFLRAHPLGEVLYAPVDVLLSPHDIYQPDLVFISRERFRIVTEKNIQGAPDLVVEILSEGTRRIDEDLKLRNYDRFGVREYWLVDPLRRAVTVYRRREEGLLQVAELRAEDEDVLTTPMLPGLKIVLGELFR